MKKSNPQDVTPAELSVLEILWKEKTAPVRVIAKALYREAAKSQHATVQKLLDRLKAKGFVAQDRTVWPRVFRPAIQQEELISRQLQSTADKFCGGSMQPLLTNLLKGGNLSDKERKSLRELLDKPIED